LQEPSPRTPRAKPRPGNALGQKLSCSLQDFGFCPADPYGPGPCGCAQRPRGGNRGNPCCSWYARRAISSGCPEPPAGRPGRNESFRGGSQLGDDSGIPSGCTQPDRAETSKVENCTRNSGSNEVAISLLRGLADPEEHQITKAVDLETAVEYLPTSLPSSLSGPPPLTAAGSCLTGTSTIPQGGSIGSVQLRRKWHPFSPALTVLTTHTIVLFVHRPCTPIWQVIDYKVFGSANGNRTRICRLLVFPISY
jgi:hypothetical protein